MSRKVAFITGASRGIGAATALALAEAGYDLAITARTLEEGESQQYADDESVALPGSLKSCAQAATAKGAEVLCLRSDVLEPETVMQAVDQALEHFGHIDLLFNCACYQGPGNMERIVDVTMDQMKNIYQGNVLTPLATVQKVLPGMIERKAGVIINIVSGSAVNIPPAPADEGGWGFAYPSSKAALIRMAHSLRVEHRDCGLRAINVEPGFVVTEAMKISGIDKEISKFLQPTTPETVAKVIVWLAHDEAALPMLEKDLVFAPQLGKKLGFVDAN